MTDLPTVTEMREALNDPLEWFASRATAVEVQGRLARMIARLDPAAQVLVYRDSLALSAVDFAPDDDGWIITPYASRGEAFEAILTALRGVK